MSAGVYELCLKKMESLVQKVSKLLLLFILVIMCNDSSASSLIMLVKNCLTKFSVLQFVFSLKVNQPIKSTREVQSTVTLSQSHTQ